MTKSDSYTLATPAGTITFNASSGDAYMNDPESCDGFDGAPLRTPIDDKPQTDGADVFDFYKSARHMTWGGDLIVRSAVTEAGYVTAREALEASMLTKLSSIIRANGTLTHVSSGKTLTVRCDVLPDFPGAWQKRYLFGLVAGAPDWT